MFGTGPQSSDQVATFSEMRHNNLSAAQKLQLHWCEREGVFLDLPSAPPIGDLSVFLATEGK